MPCATSRDLHGTSAFAHAAVTIPTRTRTARRHDPFGPLQAEADVIRRDRPAALRTFSLVGTGIAFGLMLAHMAGIGL